MQPLQALLEAQADGMAATADWAADPGAKGQGAETLRRSPPKMLHPPQAASSALALPTSAKFDAQMLGQKPCSAALGQDARAAMSNL